MLRVSYSYDWWFFWGGRDLVVLLGLNVTWYYLPVRNVKLNLTLLHVIMAYSRVEMWLQSFLVSTLGGCSS